MLDGIKIILASFIVAISLLGVIHFFGNWDATYDPPNAEMTDKAVGYGLRCVFKKHHHSFVDGHLLGDFAGSRFKFSLAKVKGSFKETFDDHSNIICYLWMAFILLFYFIEQVKIYVRSK